MIQDAGHFVHDDNLPAFLATAKNFLIRKYLNDYTNIMFHR